MLLRSLALLIAVLALAPAAAQAGSLELVGHSPLGARGMNSALAVHGDYAYVGSRSDGGPPKGGIAVVDVAQPSKPRVVRAPRASARTRATLRARLPTGRPAEAARTVGE